MQIPPDRAHDPRRSPHIFTALQQFADAKAKKAASPASPPPPHDPNNPDGPLGGQPARKPKGPKPNGPRLNPNMAVPFPRR